MASNRMMTRCIQTCVALSFILVTVTSTSEKAPTVWLGEAAAVKGLITQAVDSKTPVYNFRGIYYAAPPTGQLRFAPPARRKPFEGLADAREFGPLCHQDMEQTVKAFTAQPIPTQEVSEDCLHLNIYTSTLDEDANLAVMVHIPGGAYANGGGGFYDGTALAAHHQVVVVTVNSRLGALGYLSTRDTAAPGNYGLLDQAAALHWIGENIKKFGGNPKKITIMGESAGAMSVNLHLLSPITEGLFHRVIAQSGVATSPMAVVRDPKDLAQRLAKALKCPTDNSRVMVDCLRRRPADKIVRVRVTKRPIEFGPVIDGVLLTNDPREIQAKERLPRKEILLGFNSDEGGKSILNSRGSTDFFKLLTAATFKSFLEEMLYLVVPRDLPVLPLVRAINKIYVGEDSLTDKKARQTISDILTDSMFVAPAVNTADLLSENGLTTFLYEFEHRSSFSDLPPWAKADHGEDEAYVWGEPFMDGRGAEPDKFTEEERQLSRAMMLYWTNFAKYGTPNGVSKAEDSYHPVPFWPQYDRSEKKYMGLDATPQVSRNVKPEKVTFWNKLFSFWKLGKQRKEEL